MGIIRQIYNNDYHPADETGINDREYREATAKVHQEYERFKDTLAEEQRPELEKLMELHLDALVFGCEAAFIQGARDGAKMLLDLLLKADGLLKG